MIYFTIFYTKITHPERIAGDMKEGLVNYLKLKTVDDVENLESSGSSPLNEQNPNQFVTYLQYRLQ